MNKAMRCYNGCPDSEMKRYLDQRAEEDRMLKSLSKEARCTYFPAEGRYQVYERNQPISGFLESRSAVITEAMEFLKSREVQGEQQSQS